MNSIGRTLIAFWIITILTVTIAGNRNFGLEGGIAANKMRLVELVNGQRAYDTDLQLEKLTLDTTISHYSFRSAGSSGATAAANWLTERFRELGLDSYTESFEFTTWDLTDRPSLVLDLDNNSATTNDQIRLGSFMPKHMAWPTGKDGMFSQVVILPLPQYGQEFPSGYWDKIDVRGKIVVVGREFASFKSWRENYVAKIKNDRPSAIVQTWWFRNFSWVPPFSGSQEGRMYAPGDVELRYWDLKIPVGMVDYDDGLRIREAAGSHIISAKLTIDATIGRGPHYNVIGKLTGRDPSKIIVFSSHYDTVMSAGFGDDGAGTAGILELARAFATAMKTGIYTPPCTLMFVSFAAEELWLVGSSHFVSQHKSELNETLGVINLDPIGSDYLLVSESPSKLDEIVTAAAKELGTPIATVPREEGSSDNWSFEFPRDRDGAMRWAWNVQLGLSDVSPRPAVWLGSFPLLWNAASSGKAGWMHTPYDNSTSTRTHGWMRPQNMETHLKVAALSTLLLGSSLTEPAEVTASTSSTDTNTNGTLPLSSYASYASAVIILAIAASCYFTSLRKRSEEQLQRAHH